MRDKMYLPRRIQKLFAKFFSYFWLPCPLCGIYFGGHEWGRWGHFAIRLNDNETSKGVCFYCAKEVREEIREVYGGLFSIDSNKIDWVRADYSSWTFSS